MSMEQKARSLHCGLPDGINFIHLEDRSILPLCDVPFELQVISVQWINAVSAEVDPDFPYLPIVIDHPEYGLSLTEVGWSCFVSWLIYALSKEVGSNSFMQNARIHHLRNTD